MANQPNLTETELGQRAKDWQDELEKRIPISRLPEAFDDAIKSHKGSFPINAFEIIEAYRNANTGNIVDEWKFQQSLREANHSGSV